VTPSVDAASRTWASVLGGGEGSQYDEGVGSPVLAAAGVSPAQEV